MAYKIGIIGLTNTGKSYARRTLKNGESVFIISPSQKALHIKDSKGNPLQPLKVKSEKNNSLEEMAETTGKHKNSLANSLIKTTSKLDISGNYIVMKDIKYLEDWLKFVSIKMPHIKILILPDFTHYLSEVVANKEFIQRKSGGDAYQRLNLYF